MARGRLPVERFQSAAEKLGVIVAASNSARNGPFPPILEALQPMVADTGERLSIDPERIYAGRLLGYGDRCGPVG